MRSRNYPKKELLEKFNAEILLSPYREGKVEWNIRVVAVTSERSFSGAKKFYVSPTPLQGHLQ